MFPQIKCKIPKCDAEYIGKTERILCHRIKEHKKCKTSSCFQHKETEGHSMDYNNVEVIDSSESDFKLRIKELEEISSYFELEINA